MNTNLVVESDGTLRMDGNATAFTDLVVPVTAVRLGSGNSPEFVSMKNNGSGSRGVYTFTFENQSSSSNEQEVFFSVQMPHNWKEGTTIYPHLHWAPRASENGNVEWNFEFTWANYDATTPEVFPAISTETVVANGPFTANSHRITALTPANAGLDATGKKISSILICRLWRNSSNKQLLFRRKSK